MANYVSYLRVSTQRQGHSGLGIEAQRAAVEQYLASNGGTLLTEFVEVESGSSKARPILVQSIAQCRRCSATLVIAKIDRLARSVAFVSSLMESGIEFVAVDAPYANRLMIHILAAFAEHERLLISERTKSALAAARQRGVRLGENGRRLAAKHRSEACAFAVTLSETVRTSQQNGATTLLAIAADLNAQGCLTRAGATWSPSTVHRLLGRLNQPAPGRRRSAS
jgi:DNA invertase Pin-like site-specific DNA recombinase